MNRTPVMFTSTHMPEFDRLCRNGGSAIEREIALIDSFTEAALHIQFLEQQLAEKDIELERLKEAGNELAGLYDYFHDQAKKRGSMTGGDEVIDDFAEGWNDAWAAVEFEYEHCSKLRGRWSEVSK